MQKIVDSVDLEQTLTNIASEYQTVNDTMPGMSAAEMGELKDLIDDTMNPPRAYSMQGTETIFPPNADPRKRYYQNISNAGNHSNVGAVLPAYIYTEPVEVEP